MARKTISKKRFRQKTVDLSDAAYHNNITTQEEHDDQEKGNDNECKVDDCNCYLRRGQMFLPPNLLKDTSTPFDGKR